MLVASVTISDSRENEITDAIRSVLDEVDRVLLIDTGIADRTVDRAKEVAGRRLTVIPHTWSDFSTARNFALDAAQELGVDWAVIVDTDERINWGRQKLRATLERTKADALLVRADDGFYCKEKLVRPSSGARYVGPTHEALICQSRTLLHGVTFSELSKTEAQLQKKFQRDVAVLSEHITKDPTDPRWHFYLGVSYEGLGDSENSAVSFGKCGQLRQYGDEAAWAFFKQAEQLFWLEKWDAAIAAATNGLRVDPAFAECAWVAAEAALKKGKKAQAVTWARIAISVGRYKGCGIERQWFQHLPALYELPYAVLEQALEDDAERAEATRCFEEAKLARIRDGSNVGNIDIDRLSVSRGVSVATREDSRAALRPPFLSDLCPSANHVRIRFEPPGGRLPMNPSICKHRGKVWCVVRAINYSIQGRSYTIYDPHNVVRTENYLGVLRPDGELVNPHLMQDLDRSQRYDNGIVGYEDIRLVSLVSRGQEVLAGSATVCDRDPEGRRLIARLHFDGKGNVKRAVVQHSNQLHEKNWMPLSIGGKLTWIYSLDPTAILPGPLRDCPLKLEHIRGGAAIPYNEGFLCVVHEVVDTDEGRIYIHRFASLDEDFFVTGVSPAWAFSHYGIEFCAGLIHDRGDFVLSYGVEDREAWTVRVSAKEVEAMEWIVP